MRRIIVNQKITTLSVAGFLALAALQSCSTSQAKEETHAAPAPPLDAFQLHKGQLSSSLQIPGELIAFQQVDLYAKVNSFVKKLNVDVGSEVTEGQVLATMEAPEISSQMSGAESKLKSQEAIYLSSRATYDRLLETSKTPGTVSQNDLDVALAKQKSDYAQLQAARATYNEIGDNKNYLVIKAPFSGIITARNVSAGAYVGPSGKGSELPIFTLQEQKKLRLVISVPEAYSSYLSGKSEVSFTVKSFPDEHFTAKVTRLAGALDTRLRSQRIEMDIDNSNKKLLPGMIAEATIPMDKTDSTFIVPKTAVVNATERVFVIRIVNGKAEWVNVKLGREVEGKMEVYGALNPGDVLVKTGTEEIRNGSAVGNVKTVQ